MMRTYLVLLGPPGVGKGTQAKIVSQKMRLPHLSSGDLFRENIKNQTELGKLAETYINRGDLVPDDVTIAMIRERLSRPDCVGGALLDGFPRTTVQADALDCILAEFDGKVNAVPYLIASEKTLVERLGGRWTCRAQGHIFHAMHNPPRAEGVCDLDGSPLDQRDDDKAETVARRIHVYFEQTAPLIAYYRRRKIVCEINGAQPIENVTADLLSALGQ